MGSVTWLNETGDITLEWSKDRDDIMKNIIQQKMDEGYTFFIVKTTKKSGDTYQRVTSVDQIKKCHITMTDKEAETLIAGDNVGLTALPAADINATGRANTAEEAVANDTVATRPMRAG